MKIEDVMLSKEEELFLPYTTVLEYYKGKTETAVEVINALTLLSAGLLSIILFGAIAWIL